MGTFYVAVNYSKRQIVYFEPIKCYDVEAVAPKLEWSQEDIIYIEGDDGSEYAFSGLKPSNEPAMSFDKFSYDCNLKELCPLH
jgi:hypothetical protein